MRQSYLEAYYNLIPTTQQDRLLSSIKQSYDDVGVSADLATLQNRLETLIAQLEKPLGEPLVKFRKAEKFSKIVSKDYNDTMDEVYADLGALFKQDNVIASTMIVHKALNDTVITDVQSALQKVENDIMVYKVLRENKTGITDAIFNTFYKDDNQVSPYVYKAWVDTYTNSVKLPPGSAQTALSINGLAMADITLNRYGGGVRGTLDNEEHSKERAIDEDLRTFWAEVILTDEPIRQTYEGQSYFGVVTEIVVNLFRAESLNHVRFDPYSGYPLSVVKIKYRQGHDHPWIDLGVAPQSSTKYMEFNFKEVYAKEVMVVINQSNFTVNTYKIPKRAINNAQLWSQIADSELSISIGTSEQTSSERDMVDYTDGWQAYLDATKKYADRIYSIGRPQDYSFRSSISETIFDSTTQQMLEASQTGADSLKLNVYGKKAPVNDATVEVRKYEYLYGAYNIDIKKIRYLSTGEYVSPQYKVNGVILEAELDTTEVVPSGTTIEYQLATRESEWVNIMPNGGCSYIAKERLDIDPITQTGILRFTCSGYPDSVYMNDSPLPAYSFSNNSVAIPSGTYNSSASYTVSYTPNGVIDATPSGVVASFADNSLYDSVETFNGSDSRQYRVALAHYPYIEYRIINDTAEAMRTSPNFIYELGGWRNNSGSTLYGIVPGAIYYPFVVTVDGYSAENRTDYYEQIRPALTQYDLVNYPNFEYFQAGESIYFNTPLQNRKIIVTYKYLNDFVQLRALLRSNLRSAVYVTPVLEDYTIKLRTI